MDDRNKQIEILENFVRKINLEKKKQSQVKFTYKRCFMETFIIGKHEIKFSFLFVHSFGILGIQFNF